MNKTYIWVLAVLLFFCPARVRGFDAVKGTLYLAGGVASGYAAFMTGTFLYETHGIKSPKGECVKCQRGDTPDLLSKIIEGTGELIKIKLLWPTFIAETVLAGWFINKALKS